MDVWPFCGRGIGRSAGKTGERRTGVGRQMTEVGGRRSDGSRGDLQHCGRGGLQQEGGLMVDGIVEFTQTSFNNTPDEFQIYAEIMMNKLIAHAGNVFPCGQ